MYINKVILICKKGNQYDRFGEMPDRMHRPHSYRPAPYCPPPAYACCPVNLDIPENPKDTYYI